MRKEDLTPELQQLLRTDFGASTEKVAAEQAKIAKEMYDRGQDLALNIANSLDEEAAAQKVAAEEESLDPQMEKAAQQMGSFIERGQFDGLKKLGSDRHGNEWHYLLPFVEEKVAATAAATGLKKFTEGVVAKAKEVGGKVKDYHKGMAANASRAASGAPNKKGVATLTGGQRALEGAKAVGKASPYLAAAGLGGAALARKKD